MRIYRGSYTLGKFTVTVDNQPISDLVSELGYEPRFAWGYPNSVLTRQLSYAILKVHFGDADELVTQYTKDFAEHFLAGLGDNWLLDDSDLNEIIFALETLRTVIDNGNQP